MRISTSKAEVMVLCSQMGTVPNDLKETNLNLTILWKLTVCLFLSCKTKPQNTHTLEHTKKTKADHLACMFWEYTLRVYTWSDWKCVNHSRNLVQWSFAAVRKHRELAQWLAYWHRWRWITWLHLVYTLKTYKNYTEIPQCSDPLHSSDHQPCLGKTD